MIYVLYTIHVVVSIFLILVVLLQQGKGADLSVFGGGSTQAAFGARGAATLLHKLTVGGFVLFVVTTLSISLMKGSADRSSVMRAVEAQQQETLGQEAETPAAGETASPPEAEAGGAAETGAPEAEAESAPPAEPPVSGQGASGQGASGQGASGQEEGSPPPDVE